MFCTGRITVSEGTEVSVFVKGCCKHLLLTVNRNQPAFPYAGKIPAVW